MRLIRILGQGFACKCSYKKKNIHGDSKKLVLFSGRDAYYKRGSFQPPDCVIMFYSFTPMKLPVITDSEFSSFGFGRINYSLTFILTFLLCKNDTVC